MKAYEECLSATSTGDSPWYLVPADDKENARLIVSQIVSVPRRTQDVIPAHDRSAPKQLLAIRKGLEK
jgi:Polyphosphate kinase 2 (PPK2)